MNVYVPVEYYEGKAVNGYTAKDAPIFFPNSVGGLCPASPAAPARTWRAPVPNAALVALSRGYVVAAPGARGRTTKTSDGVYTGKAPACIVDLKAAVRYLRYNDKDMPGDAEKIISNGTSAGGALSALLGASGNNRDYEPYLKTIGGGGRARRHLCRFLLLPDHESRKRRRGVRVALQRRQRLPQNRNVDDRLAYGAERSFGER